MSICKAGWCQKEGGRIKTIKKRWFVLQADALTYYTKDDGKEKGKIQFTPESEVQSDINYKKQPCFTLKARNNDRIYRIFPDTEDERDAWVSEIQQCIGKILMNQSDLSFPENSLTRSAIRKMRANQRLNSPVQD
ncbi:PH domain containing protein [Trichomonas vaginalis G3]|uniref:PH domain containing protein n=1 Tax=Trichomonas vaginalis (strain ATCC PRA-98 / G3) TaxID=412133 RepID=A2E8D1_TRIV3|nr:spectrin binding [Trichomonas vaginalis G3]EAY11059.1 PH domain containing protein [Trichomonas vaginalis G3]KAI5520519.1 spectrin binding [Trichomonas vaginalis G3]|eukprot:XP_001323282.1 PH domain containing protein [Trichomonas vaginalis G3]